jgi:hypothetical protein
VRGTSNHAPIMTDAPLEFDPEVMRRLVASDPLLAYTVVRHASESEERWLSLVFVLEVQADPGLTTRYRALASRSGSQPRAA